MNKLQEASRNELLALTKSQTVTRYNKSEEYKGFTIKDIKTDEILGSVLTISHNDKLTTVYYTFGEIKVSVGDNVTKGTVIATSGTTKLQTAKPQTLLFEVYYNHIC